MTPIKDYALIGNCETAALIGPDGGIDWLCLPAFDSPSICARLLDDTQGGDFTIAPAGPLKSRANTSTVFEPWRRQSIALQSRFIRYTALEARYA